MNQIANIGYGSDFEDYCSNFEDRKEAEQILKQQMDRIAKMFGFDEAWFY